MSGFISAQVLLLVGSAFVGYFAKVECRPQPRFKRQYVLPGGTNQFFVPPSGPRNPLPVNMLQQGFGFGTQVDDNKAQIVDGMLEFPVIEDNKKFFQKFDLAGSLSVGQDPFGLNFGETVNPTNPYDLAIDRLYPCLLGLCRPTAGQFANNPLGAQRMLQPLGGIQPSALGVQQRVPQTFNTFG